MTSAHEDSGGLRQFGSAVADSASFRIIGIVSGTLSLISLSARTFQIGLSGVFIDIVDFFRAFAHAVFGLLPKIAFNFEIPQSIADLWTLSFMGAGALYYARRRLGGDQERRFSAARDVFSFVVTGLIMGGIAYFFLALLAVPILLGQYALSLGTRVPIRWSGTDAVYQETASWIIIAVCGAILFFALNAFAPGP